MNENDKNNEYFEKMEDYCYSILEKLNDDQDIFTAMSRTPQFSCIDASGETKGGCIAMMELKARTGETLHLSDFFIESKKIAYLLLGWITKGYVPLYINYIQCKLGEMPKKILVWRLDRLNEFAYHPWTATWSEGYQQIQKQERFGLYPSDATIYEWDEKNETYKMTKNANNVYRGC